MAYLKQRETGGYVTHEVAFHPKDTELSSFTVLVYIGTEAGQNYLGPAPIEAIARQVVNSRGHGGSNVEYALKLAEVMRTIVPTVCDEHVFALEAKVKELLQAKGEGCKCVGAQ